MTFDDLERSLQLLRAFLRVNVSNETDARSIITASQEEEEEEECLKKLKKCIFRAVNLLY